MRAAKTKGVVNRLLESSPGPVRKKLMDSCEVVQLTFGEVLCEPGRAYRHVYFPLDSFISLVSSVGRHPPLEMGLIGSEGMLGATIALDVPLAPLRAVVQGAGSALRMSATDLRRRLADAPALRAVIHRYLYVLNEQLSQTAACTRFHTIEERLARWLLMSHDRAHADHFYLTHQFMANMLGVLRSGITIAAGALQEKGWIRYTRGEITILNRPELEGAACECYEAIVEDYRRILK